MRLVELAGPLVHGGHLAALKLHVLANVEWAAERRGLRQVTAEPVDERTPGVAVQRAGPDVDLRVRRRIRNAVSIAPVIVRMDVEHHEATMSTLALAQHALERRVELVVLGE
jgi:hypothetical protein